LSNDPTVITDASHLILPGVGAFGAAMKKIRQQLPLETIQHQVLEESKPFLGICVGMHVLMAEGLEYGRHSGLGWIPGQVNKLDSTTLRLPHIGWNDVEIVSKQSPFGDQSFSTSFYFLHSFAVRPLSRSAVVGVTEYGEEFVSIVQSGNIVGVQFHPEKSQRSGMQLLKTFADEL